MPGEKELAKMLETIEPKLQAGDYVFCSVRDVAGIDMADVVLYFREEEGITVILKKEKADQLQLPYSFVAAWITLTVHSSLEAVGLTAAFSTALAVEGISCNVVAAYFHDHIFVPQADALKAIQVIRELAGLKPD
jgi:uncharacterized protein